LLIPPPGGKPIHITDDQAKEYVRKYFEKYSGVRIFHKKVENMVKARLAQNGEFGYVTLLSNRLRRLDREYLTNHETAYPAITQAINSIIQGGVSDLIKWAMVQIQEEFRKRGWLGPENGIWDAYIIGQVHDEIFCECKEELAEEVKQIVKNKMEEAGIKFNIKVPMTADAHIVNNLSEK
jgi:DNA polymerase I-like protein with 3'-5' exonuclease and polymerase domains